MNSAIAFLLIKSRGKLHSNSVLPDSIDKIPIYSDSVVLGRHPYCSIVLDNAAISREHTRIEHSSNGFTIEDLQSRNGTWLNNKPLVRKSFLYNGDTIRICDITIVFSSGLPEAKRPSKEESCLGSQTVIINNDSLKDLNISSRINIHNFQHPEPPVGCGDYVKQISNLQNKINVLMSFAKNMGKASNPSDLLPRFLSSLLQLFPQADYACLLTPDRNTEKFEIFSFQRRNPNDLTPIHISRSLLETVIQSRNGILSEETRCTGNKGNACQNSLLEGGKTLLRSEERLSEMDKESLRVDKSNEENKLSELRCRKSRLGVRRINAKNLENNPKDVSQGSLDFMPKLQKYSTMAVPILDVSLEDEVLGVLKLDSLDFQKPFSHDDLDLLIAVANQAAVYYENSKYQEMCLKESMLTQEMTVAHKVQKGFLPTTPPKILHYDFFDYYKPAQYLGGDYFDYISLPDGRLAITLGDVSGKGISASLLMAQLSSEVRYSLLLEKTLPETMERLNRSYSENHWDNRFITFLLVVLDPKLHNIHILNAGHPFPVLSRTNGEVLDVGDGYQNYPLGIASDTQYEEYVLQLQPGELITMMSDGIADAMNAQNDCFSMNQVRKYLNNSKKFNAEQLGKRLLDQVKDFVGSVSQTDDQCLIIFGRQ